MIQNRLLLYITDTSPVKDGMEDGGVSPTALSVDLGHSTEEKYDWVSK